MSDDQSISDISSAPESGIDGEVAILHRDDDLVVVHKPAGMLVHRGMGAASHERFLLQEVRDMCGAWVYPVHRLDRPTCGLVVFCFASESAGALQKAWQTGTVAKRYRAIVRGWMPESEGRRDEALDSPDNGTLQEAATRWRELGRVAVPGPLGKWPVARLAWMDLDPETGRWHQLRRHFARMGHPLAGDTTHGDRHTNHFLRDRYGWWRLMLWARELRLPHPTTGQEMTFTDADDRGILKYWDALRADAVERP